MTQPMKGDQGQTRQPQRSGMMQPDGGEKIHPRKADRSTEEAEPSDEADQAEVKNN